MIGGGWVVESKKYNIKWSFDKSITWLVVVAEVDSTTDKSINLFDDPPRTRSSWVSRLSEKMILFIDGDTERSLLLWGVS